MSAAILTFPVRRSAPATFQAALRDYARERARQELAHTTTAARAEGRRSRTEEVPSGVRAEDEILKLLRRIDRRLAKISAV